MKIKAEILVFETPKNYEKMEMKLLPQSIKMISLKQNALWIKNISYLVAGTSIF